MTNTPKQKRTRPFPPPSDSKVLPAAEGIRGEPIGSKVNEPDPETTSDVSLPYKRPYAVNGVQIIDGESRVVCHFAGTTPWAVRVASAKKLCDLMNHNPDWIA